MLPEPTVAEVAIVGGGAAGLATANFAAQRGARGPIVVLDGARKLGAKILVSGGGRCNVTNRQVGPADFYGGNPHILRRVLAGFPPARTIEFFAAHGVPLHEEEHGKIFPDSHAARDVVAALLRAAGAAGVDVWTGRRVISVARRDDGFELQFTTQEEQPRTLRTRRVVLATGGCSLPKTGSDGAGYELAAALGHSLVPPTPALVPLVLSGELHAGLAGVSHEVELTVHAPPAKPLRIAGAMLWTHFGLSGPVVLNASRFWLRARLERRPVRLTVNFLPGRDFESAERELLSRASTRPRATVGTVLSEWLPGRVAEALRAAADVSDRSLAQLSRADRRRLLHVLLEWPAPVVGDRGWNYAEVTAGGVPLREVDGETLASRVCPGLFLVGEILDVDGRIGGFNFQWAWSSAWAAAGGLARDLARGTTVS